MSRSDLIGLIGVTRISELTRSLTLNSGIALPIVGRPLQNAPTLYQDGTRVVRSPPRATLRRLAATAVCPAARAVCWAARDWYRTAVRPPAPRPSPAAVVV